MSEIVDDPMPPEARESQFKSELHKAINAAQMARKQASRQYMQSRDQLIEHARSLGSETPERDVARVQSAILQGVDRKEHRDVHAVFERFGWTRDRPSVAFAQGEDRETGPRKTGTITRRRPREQDVEWD